MRSPTDDDVVSRWADFPIDVEPRPIVLLEPRVRLDGGFDDREAKVAWLGGVIESELPVPESLLALLRANRPRQDAPALMIAAVTRTVAEFRCDRGPRELASYRVDFAGYYNHAIVLAPEVEPWWPTSDDHPDAGATAVVESDDVTIQLPAFGGVLTEFHRAEFKEYSTCVVGRAVTSERPARPGTAVAAMGIIRKVTGQLTRPLRGRVLLNASGAPLAVVPAAAP